ncbi:MAG TPA: hypothetical protein VMB73_20530 [Acetobacteraceae bacterium]|nr:hypothetical protein [Acetobacteraceae bacterium]
MEIAVVVTALHVALWFILASGFSAAATIWGLRRILPTLGAAALSVGAIALLTKGDIRDLIYVDASAILVAVVAGAFAGRLMTRHRETEILRVVRERYIEIVQDRRIVAILAAMLVAVMATYVFAILEIEELGAGFWHGFYQAWCAAIVFFGILGISSTFVTLYRPEKEEFATRVRILCGGRQGPTVDYIRQKIRQIGYHAEMVRRHHRVVGYDAERKAYEIEVTHSSDNRNFYDDEAVDAVTFGLKPDPLDPPLPNGRIGLLMGVEVNGLQVNGPELIPADGLRKSWPIEIKKGDRAHVKVGHRCWYLTTKEHTFRTNRFANHVHATFELAIPDSAPELVISSFRRANPANLADPTMIEVSRIRHVLEPGETFTGVPPSKNCIPGDIVFQMTFIAPPGSDLVTADLGEYRQEDLAPAGQSASG